MYFILKKIRSTQSSSLLLSYFSKSNIHVGEYRPQTNKQKKTKNKKTEIIIELGYILFLVELIDVQIKKNNLQ